MKTNYNAVMPVTARPDVVFERGEGAWLLDRQGNRYLDFVQGWAVNTLGHAHQNIVTALEKQLHNFINVSPAYYSFAMIELAEQLVTHSDFEHVFFTNSGAEANEGAIKLARKWGAVHRAGAYKIITFENSFHGRTLATMSASGKKGWDKLFLPKMPGFITVPYNDLEAVEAAIDDMTVAVMLEPIQGEAGVIPAEKNFLKGLRALADQHKMLLIFDEIQTGIGRTSTLFNYQQSDIFPDILTLGKGIGGGVPLGALLATAQSSCFDYGEQGGTFNGNALCCAAGVAVLETILSGDFLSRVAESGEYLKLGLRQLSDTCGLGEVRGQGLLCALDTSYLDAKSIADTAFASGLLINAAQPTTLRFMPALNVSHKEIDLMLDILFDCIKDVANER